MLPAIYFNVVTTGCGAAEAMTALKHYVPIFGAPQAVLCYNGAAFIDKDFKQHVMAELRAKYVNTSPYYPQGNGINESSHQALADFCSENFSDLNKWMRTLYDELKKQQRQVMDLTVTMEDTRTSQADFKRNILEVNERVEEIIHRHQSEARETGSKFEQLIANIISISEQQTNAIVSIKEKS
eukprot:GHVH01012328.1.p1 GENE.GHVH01012328.1~~GHVH01012328.1.p1  ORF type:complete len:183 (-),score=25.28 GHVH01012328.1:568-1116(-)